MVKKIVEIMAPICLRDAFLLTDGDSVTVMLNDSTPQKAMSVKAAIFDLDGTLIDSTHVYYAIIEAAFDRLGLPVVPRSNILEAARQDQFDWNLVLPPEALQSNPQLIDEVRQQINALYSNIFHQQVIPIPGTYETLTKIAQTGAPIGVVTSTPNANMSEKRAILEKYDIEPLLDIIITSDDTKRKKPAPDPLYLCAQRLGVLAKDCVYVGDMISDIQAGKNAGMKAIAVLTGFDNYNTLNSTNPDALIPSMAQFHQVVQLD